MTPQGYGAVWGTLAAAALALLGYQLLRVGEHQVPSEAGPSSSPTVLASGTPASAASRAGSGAVVVALPAPPGPGGTQASTVPAAAASAASSSTPAPVPPSPRPSPLVALSAMVAVPVRSATPLEVRVGLVVPTGPPWPLLPGGDVTLGLP